MREYTVVTGKDLYGQIVTIMIENPIEYGIEDYFKSDVTNIKDVGIVQIVGNGSDFLPSELNDGN